MASIYKRRSALAANMDNPGAVLDALIAHDLGERAAAHITPQEHLMAGTKRMKRKLKERMVAARINGGLLQGNKQDWLREGIVDDSKLDPLGLKRKAEDDGNEEDAKKRLNGSIRGATWLNKYLDHVDYIDNVQLERMAKAQAELQLRDEMGLTRRPTVFDPTWGRGDPHGDMAQKGLDVWNSLSPTLVTHTNSMSRASSKYPHAPWCAGHMCGMTCNPEGAKQLQAVKFTESQAAKKEEEDKMLESIQRTGPLYWGSETQSKEKVTRLDRAIMSAAAQSEMPAKKPGKESAGPSHAIQPIGDYDDQMWGAVRPGMGRPDAPAPTFASNIEARAKGLATGLRMGQAETAPSWGSAKPASVAVVQPAGGDDEAAEC